LNEPLFWTRHSGHEAAALSKPFSKGFGGHTGGVTPDPISNSEVKTSRADGTAGEALWESRSPPEVFSWPSSIFMELGYFFCARSLWLCLAGPPPVRRSDLPRGGGSPRRHRRCYAKSSRGGRPLMGARPHRARARRHLGRRWRPRAWPGRQGSSRWEIPCTCRGGRAGRRRFARCWRPHPPEQSPSDR
jgi:hypothetical protein